MLLLYTPPPPSGLLQPVYESFQLVVLHQPHELVHHLPVLDAQDRGHGVHLVLHGQLGKVVDVYYGQVDGSLLVKYKLQGAGFRCAGNISVQGVIIKPVQQWPHLAWE